MENLQGGTLSLEHRYRVEHREGQFRLVTRYRGLQLPFERPVWLEVYDPLAEAGAAPRVFERLKRSAHRAHQIDHRHVLRTLDYGEIDKGIPFVVSERIDGPTLSDYLDRQGPLSPREATDLADGIADALEAAHEVGLPHGTLGRDWVFLQDDNPAEPRVGHFQVGLTLGELRRIDGAVLTPELVRPYPPETFERDTIPPEEVGDDGAPTDEFTVAGDVYALGCIVYESVVGFHPYFDDEDSTDASEGIVRLQNDQNDEPRPLEEFGLPPDFSKVVRRAIAHEPAARWETPARFAQQLRATQDQTERTAPPESDASTQPDSTPADESTADEEPGALTTPGSSDDELEPGGPSSVLVTLVVAILLASNVAWFFFYMKRRSSAPEPPAEPNRSADRERKLSIDSRPGGAAVFAPGREEPVGRTPVEIPPQLLDSGSVELELKKTGFSETTISVRTERSRRTITVDLTQTTGE